MPIQFGIFDHIEMSGDQGVQALYESRITFLKRAEEAGFYGFHLAEHHGHRLSASPSASVFLAALARETTRLKLIPTVVCLPLHHPVRVYEDLAMLDVLSHGRLELGLGKGITKFEHLQFGHDPEEASARAREISAMLLEAWETGIISSEDSTFYDFTELKLPFEPVQHPYPPLWTAGNVEVAGRGGHNFVTTGPVTAAARARYDELRAASREQPGHQNPHVKDPLIGQTQSVVIAPTEAEAKAILRRAWSYYNESITRARGTVPPHLQTELPAMDNPVAQAVLDQDPLESGMAVAGTVEQVRDYYVEQARQGHANYFVLMIPFGDMTAEEATHTLDAFAEHVIPAVREAVDE
ncbi:LLM class flavin-dependent oxidoreductase [Streptomyces sp. NPDC005492]|uniref:LLM class flavin-dependent oxidoreductase n=1 Tax=Streptomyces sp. NPDC005492 TaxID=3156883 RepID=UPI0033A9E94E